LLGSGNPLLDYFAQITHVTQTNETISVKVRDPGAIKFRKGGFSQLLIFPNLTLAKDRGNLLS